MSLLHRRTRRRRPVVVIVCAAVGLLLALVNARAVILLRTADPEANTFGPTAPGDVESGWDYQGFWGDFLGTPIAPHFFVSAAHVGHQGTFVFRGANYAVVQGFHDPATDLMIWEVAEEFPEFAPLYSRRDEVGRRMIEFGRGTQRGAAVRLNGAMRGWYWGAADKRQRWGANIVSAILSYAPDNDLLVAKFNKRGLPNECHLSSGDSGGAAFIKDGDTWKLAGINFAVDGPFYTSPDEGTKFDAALFDARGFYYQENDTFQRISGPRRVPSALYPTRISTRLAWIASVLAAPKVTREGNFATISYTRLLLPAAEVSYSVLQSTDAKEWTAVT
ncbi:MAG: hypothetical protein ABR589_08485, partial [Chthoniobacterales bacterium]